MKFSSRRRVLELSFLDDWRCGGILVPTSYGFFLILLHCSHSYDEKNQVKKKKGSKKNRMNNTYFDEWFPCDQDSQQ